MKGIHISVDLNHLIKARLFKGGWKLLKLALRNTEIERFEEKQERAYRCISFNLYIMTVYTSWHYATHGRKN
jgi:hypothetical protein